MVAKLLKLREDIFDNYSREFFLDAMAKFARITQSIEISEGGRLFVRYEAGSHK